MLILFICSDCVSRNQSRSLHLKYTRLWSTIPQTAKKSEKLLLAQKPKSMTQIIDLDVIWKSIINWGCMTNNMKPLSPTVQTLKRMFKFTTNKQSKRQGKNNMHPIFLSGRIKMFFMEFWYEQQNFHRDLRSRESARAEWAVHIRFGCDGLEADIPSYPSLSDSRSNLWTTNKFKVLAGLVAIRWITTWLSCILWKLPKILP